MMLRCAVGLLLLCCGLSLGKPAPRQDSCGYASCDLGKSDMLNVHLIAHTHDDVGWLKTVDQYFYGYKNYIQRAGVRYILDTSVQQLLADGRRRFIYVEIAFFYRWWNQQSEALKTQVRNLVNKGTLQFILGGWCMNDEASTHYAAIIDQHTLGLQFLSQEFGDCGRPRVAWQIDPFGHAREMASLFAQMGYDAVYFWRADYQDINNRRSKGQLELIWRGSDSLPNTDLFTGMLNTTYCPPSGFCWDENCSDDPIMDDRRMHDYNVKKRVDDFLMVAKFQAKYYTTNHIMIPMGCDFNFQNARQWFLNLDKLIKYTNARQANGSKVNLIYSTPTCYTYAVNSAKATYTSLKTDDFFPYADSPHSFWTGYFTSRAALKRMVRRASAQLQSVRQLALFSRLPAAKTQPAVDMLRRALGVAQHHDAVSGTEKQAVAFDYAQRLSEGLAPALQVAVAGFKVLTSIGGDWEECPLTNISSCALSKAHKTFTVALYNPASHSRNTWVRLPTNVKGLELRDLSGRQLPAALLPVSARTRGIPEGRRERADYDLWFRAPLPALGGAAFEVRLGLGPAPARLEAPRGESLALTNGIVTLKFDTTSGLLQSFDNSKFKAHLPLLIALGFYTGYQDKGRASGAYVFRPNEEIPNSPATAQLTLVNAGGDVQEMHQTFAPWLTLVYRLYKDADFAEIEWTVGPIPHSDRVGREVILHYKTPFDVDHCYTDSNGRQLLKRTINYRPTWNFKNSEPVSGNYYPINTRIIMRNSQGLQLSILTDRSEGGGCPRKGELEVMLHRWTMKDDGLGVGEPLNELGSDGKGLIVRGTHRLYLDPFANSDFQRQESVQRFMEPLMMLSTSGHAILPFSALKQSLPSNVQLLTAENWDGGRKLLRFEHFYEASDFSLLRDPVTFDINIFKSFNVTNVEVMTLAANQKLADSKRLSWKLAKGAANTTGSGVSVIGTKLTLQPMAIATLLVS